MLKLHSVLRNRSSSPLHFSISAFTPMSLPDPKQTAIWKTMSGAEKYQLLAATIRQTRELKRMGIRLRNPQTSPAEIERILARIWLHARP